MLLNRTLTWTNDGISYEAAPRHVEIAMEELGLNHAHWVVTPGTKEEGTTTEDDETKLDDFHISKYRAMVARLNRSRPTDLALHYPRKSLPGA